MALELLFSHFPRTTDDLVITAENKAEASNRFNRWKRAMEKRGLKVNYGKDKGDDNCKAAKQKTRRRKISMWMLWKERRCELISVHRVW